MRHMALLMAAIIGTTTLAAAPAFADCQSDFAAVRGELETRGKAIQAATKRKAPPQELCPLFKAYVSAEAKVGKFLSDNKDWCQIPQQVIDQSKEGNKRSSGIRDKVCAAAANGGVAPGSAPPPAQSSISSALGITTGYVPGQSSSGGGVFDTLTGNALQAPGAKPK